MAKHQQREYQFKTDSKDYTVAEFYEKYKDQFPQLVQVTHGFDGNEFCNVILKRNQTLSSSLINIRDIIPPRAVGRQLKESSRQSSACFALFRGVFHLILVNVNSKIARALTRVKFNGGRKLVSIPDSFHENLCVVQDGECGPEQTLYDILMQNKPPLLIRFPKDRTTKSGIPTEYFPVFEVFDAFDEIHLLANIVSTDIQNPVSAAKGYRCEIVSDVINIPLYLPQLRMSVVSGILKQPPELWNEILEELNLQSFQYEYDLLFGKSDIDEYSSVDLSRQRNFSTVQPDAVISTDSFLMAVAYENKASKRTDRDEIEDSVYEEPYSPTAMTHETKETEAETTEDYENVDEQVDVLVDEPGGDYEEVATPESLKQDVSLIQGNNSNTNKNVVKGRKAGAMADLEYVPMSPPPLPDRPVKDTRVKFVKSLTDAFEGKKTVTINETVTRKLSFEEKRSNANPLYENKRENSGTYINDVPRTSVKPSTVRQLLPENQQVKESVKNEKQPTSDEHSLMKPSTLRKNSQESSGKQESVKEEMSTTTPETQMSNVPATPTLHVSSLTIKQVGEHLKKLNLGKYVDDFQAQRVDGAILVEMDRQMLREDFGLSGIEALRLLKFAQEGHVPM